VSTVTVDEEAQRIGANIRAARLGVGITNQAVLATRVNARLGTKFRFSHVSRWENGRIPSRKTLGAIADICGVTRGWLYDEHSDPRDAA
jgi:transcriptional regulator with XRE-family HTH domain